MDRMRMGLEVAAPQKDRIPHNKDPVVESVVRSDSVAVTSHSHRDQTRQTAEGNSWWSGCAGNVVKWSG